MSKRLKIILGIIGTVLVLGTASAIIFWPSISGFVVQFFQKGADEDDTIAAPEPALKSDTKLYSDAETIAVSKGPEAGQQVFDDRLDQTTEKADRAAIYIQKASFATTKAGGSDKEEALEYAYKAETENPTYGTAILIANLEYNNMGNAVTGLKYYKLYLERLTEDGIALNPGDKEYVEQLVRDIEAKI
jgi:hypothetical protein